MSGEGQGDIRKVALVAVRGGRLLVVRKRGQSTFILPGGKPEPGDDGEAATLAREVREELSCDVADGSLRPLDTFRSEAAYDPGRTVVVAAYAGTLVGDPVASSEIGEVLWFDPATGDRSTLATTIRDGVLPRLAAEPGWAS